MINPAEQTPDGEPSLYEFLTQADAAQLQDWLHLPSTGPTHTFVQQAFSVEPADPRYPTHLPEVGEELDPQAEIPASKEFCSLVGRPLGILIHVGRLSLRDACHAGATMMPMRPMSPARLRVFVNGFGVAARIIGDLLPEPLHPSSIISQSIFLARGIQKDAAALGRLRVVVEDRLQEIKLPPPPSAEELDTLRMTTLMETLFKGTPLLGQALAASPAMQLATVKRLNDRYWGREDRNYKARSTPDTQVKRLWKFCVGTSTTMAGRQEGVHMSSVLLSVSRLAACLQPGPKDIAALQLFLEGEDPTAQIELGPPPEIPDLSKEAVPLISWHSNLELVRLPSVQSTKRAARPKKPKPEAKPPETEEACTSDEIPPDISERLYSVLREVADLNILSQQATADLLTQASGAQEVAPDAPVRHLLARDAASFIRKAGDQLTSQQRKLAQRFFGKGETPGVSLKHIAEEQGTEGDPQALERSMYQLYLFCATWTKG